MRGSIPVLTTTPIPDFNPSFQKILLALELILTREVSLCAGEALTGRATRRGAVSWLSPATQRSSPAHASEHTGTSGHGRAWQPMARASAWTEEALLVSLPSEGPRLQMALEQGSHRKTTDRERLVSALTALNVSGVRDARLLEGNLTA